MINIEPENRPLEHYFPQQTSDFHVRTGRKCWDVGGGPTGHQDLQVEDLVY